MCSRIQQSGRSSISIPRGKWLQLLFTVDDPSVFTTAVVRDGDLWSAIQSAGPGANAWPEDICAENPHKYGTEEDVQLPTAKVADF